MLKDYLFTSESVSEGHPDKVADCISDSILDAFLSKDKFARVAMETLVTTNTVVISGEIRLAGEIPNFETIIRQTIKKIGYEQEKFHWQNVTIHNFVHEQSADIAMGVDTTDKKDEGAGDQGLMFGYACKETKEYMPAPIHYSHAILEALSKKRHASKSLGLEPDAKSQVTLEYKNGVPVSVSSIVVSHQHAEKLSLDELKEIIIPTIKEVIPEDFLTHDTKYYVNPTGRFVIGGPDGDTGLTGRKIIVDTYGGSSPHGGGAFSGKDPTKVDRSAAYMARYLAKNIVAAGLSEKCTIQLSYAIGVSQPLSVYVNTAGVGLVPESKIVEFIRKNIDLSPRGIRELLKLNNPIYSKTASYGHFGRLPEKLENGAETFTWEKLDLVEKLKNNI